LIKWWESLEKKLGYGKKLPPFQSLLSLIGRC